MRDPGATGISKTAWTLKPMGVHWLLEVTAEASGMYPKGFKTRP